MKVRVYHKVNRKGQVTGKFRLRPDQIKKLNAEMLNGERLMRHPPHLHTMNDQRKRKI